MTAVDTNLLVRLLTHDDEEQYRRAYGVFGSGPVLVTDTVWLETEWVLRYAYGYNPAAVVRAFRGVLGLPGVYTTDARRIILALEWHESGMDFADALHLAGSQDADAFLTFDQAMIRAAIGRGRCPVSSPA